MSGFDDADAPFLDQDEFEDDPGVFDWQAHQAAAEANAQAEAFLESCETMEDEMMDVGPPPLLPTSNDVVESPVRPSHVHGADGGHSILDSDSPHGASSSASSSSQRSPVPSVSSAHSSLSTALPPLKRVRLKNKQSAPAFYAQQHESKFIEMISRYSRDEAFQSYKKLDAKSRRNAYKRLGMAKARFLEKLQKQHIVEMAPGRQIKVDPHKPLALQTKRAVQEWLEYGATSRTLADVDRGCFISNLLMSYSSSVLGSAGQQFQRIVTPTVLLTWQGDWGLREAVATEDEDDEFFEGVCKRIMEDASFQALWAEFKAQCRAWCDSCGLQEWAASMELCTRTLVLQKVVRVHLHGWFLVPMGSSHSTLMLKDFLFKDSVPHISSFKIATTRGSGQRWAGCFYVTASKVGSLCSTSTKEMFIDYGVSPSWVTSLLSARKLSWDVAIDLYYRCVSNAEQNVRVALACREHERAQKTLKQRMEIEHQIRQKQRPFKTIPEVQEWLEQFKEVNDRYKFLVLDGKSQTGKTRFAANMTTPDRFLNIDCSSATEPDLRSFVRGKHDVVLFDEGRPQLILRAKKLAQASVDEVRLGQSATNVNSYKLWFHRIKLVVASNVWASSLKQLDPVDSAWLTANSIYIFVDSPLHE